MYNAKAKKFSKILVPIDGSELSMKATDYAVTRLENDKEDRTTLLN
jgi:nucleotide-binding universal stress UspA family protein